MYTSVMEILDEAGISYEVRPHSKSVYTVEEAARERGVRTEQIVKVMVAKRKDGAFLAALIPGHRRLDLKKLRRELGDKKIRLAPPAEIEQLTGLQVGAISPLGIHSQMAMYIDRGVLDEEMVAISCGSPDAGLLLSSEALVKLLGGRLGDFT